MLDQVDYWSACLVPWPCILCGERAGIARVCLGCRTDLPWITHPCLRCSVPLPPGAAAGLCAACDLSLTGLDQVRAGLVYEYPVDSLVSAAKFQARREFARALGELLVEALARQSSRALSADLIVPVPLHPARLGRRGYNQAVEIARPVAAALGLPLITRLCRRSRNTAAQSALAGRARRKNLAAAFRVRGSVARARVLIVDDVVTTGQTLSSLAGSLRRAGAAQVTAWCAARVVTDQARLNV